MKTFTTTEFRNEFRRVSAWLDNGESVRILKRGKPYATLVPAVKAQAKQPPKVDFKTQRDAIWKGRKFSAEQVAEMREAEHENGF